MPINNSKKEIILNDLKAVGNILCRTGKMAPGYKSMVTLELSSVCNLSCPLCPTGAGKTDRNNKFMPFEMLQKIMSMTRSVASGYVLGMWGEPLLYPRLKEALDLTVPMPTWTSTNLNCPERTAHLLAECENLHVICALDTLDPSDYPLYRVNGNYNKVLKNLRIISKGKCNVYPQFLVDPNDYKEDAFTAFADDLGIDPHNVVIKNKRENFTLEVDKKVVPGICHSPYLGLYFNCDGDLLPCCNDVKRDIHIANVDDYDSLEELVSAARAVDVRKKLAKDKNAFISCGQCRGESYWKIKLPVYARGLLQRLPGFRGGKARPQRMPFEE